MGARRSERDRAYRANDLFRAELLGAVSLLPAGWRAKPCIGASCCERRGAYRADDLFVTVTKTQSALIADVARAHVGIPWVSATGASRFAFEPALIPAPPPPICNFFD